MFSRITAIQKQELLLSIRPSSTASIGRTQTAFMIADFFNCFRKNSSHGRIGPDESAFEGAASVGPKFVNHVRLRYQLRRAIGYTMVVDQALASSNIRAATASTGRRSRSVLITMYPSVTSPATL